MRATAKTKYLCLKNLILLRMSRIKFLVCSFLGVNLQAIYQIFPSFLVTAN